MSTATKSTATKESPMSTATKSAATKESAMSTATKESAMSTAIKAARNGAAVTAATLAPVAETVAAALAQTSTVAGDLVTRTTEVVTPLVQAAAGSGRALSDGVAAQAKTVAGLTVDVYQQAVRRQLDRSIVLADAVPVGWVGQLTRRNAAAIGELAAVYADATHDLLQ